MVMLGGFAVAVGQRRAWKKTRWAWFGALWVAGYALSYFWSEDKAQWGTALSVKLPILLLPVAFALLPKLDLKRLRILLLCFFAIMLAGALYSFAHFLADPKQVIAGYNVSHVLRTPLFNSHIHFSALVACSITIGIATLPIFNRFKKRLVIAALIILVVYLHFLASKTGLVMLYVLGAFMLFRLAMQGKPLRALAALLVMVAATWAAFMFIPTLKSRANYVRYTIVQVVEGRRDGLYSDLGRALSWRVGGQLVGQYAALGVGAGDMLTAMRGEYKKAYPAVAEENHLIPHNQPLCVALAAGVPAFLFFVFWLLMPLRWLYRHPRRFYFRVTWAMLLVPLLVEPFLEVQAGVAVYLYALLFCHYALRCMGAEVAVDAPDRRLPE